VSTVFGEDDDAAVRPGAVVSGGHEVAAVADTGALVARSSRARAWTRRRAGGGLLGEGAHGLRRAVASAEGSGRLGGGGGARSASPRRRGSPRRRRGSSGSSPSGRGWIAADLDAAGLVVERRRGRSRVRAKASGLESRRFCRLMKTRRPRPLPGAHGGVAGEQAWRGRARGHSPSRLSARGWAGLAGVLFGVLAGGVEAAQPRGRVGGARVRILRGEALDAELAEVALEAADHDGASASAPATGTPRVKRIGSRISSRAEKELEWPLWGVALRKRRLSKRGRGRGSRRWCRCRRRTWWRRRGRRRGPRRG
jgi:hypothetical protein